MGRTRIRRHPFTEGPHVPTRSRDRASRSGSPFSAEPDTYRGHHGVLRYFESFHDAMTDIHFHPERLWDAGEWVVVDVRLTAKGRRTEIQVEQRLAQVWSVRDGRARAARNYESISEALAAAGLRE